MGYTVLRCVRGVALCPVLEVRLLSCITVIYNLSRGFLYFHLQVLVRWGCNYVIVIHNVQLHLNLSTFTSPKSIPTPSSICLSTHSLFISLQTLPFLPSYQPIFLSTHSQSIHLSISISSFPPPFHLPPYTLLLPIPLYLSLPPPNPPETPPVATIVEVHLAGCIDGGVAVLVSVEGCHEGLDLVLPGDKGVAASQHTLHLLRELEYL